MEHGDHHRIIARIITIADHRMCRLNDVGVDLTGCSILRGS